jgi:hypothetical protein
MKEKEKKRKKKGYRKGFKISSLLTVFHTTEHAANGNYAYSHR